MIEILFIIFFAVSGVLPQLNNSFIVYGDIFQFMSLFMMIFLLCVRDIDGFFRILISTILVSLIIVPLTKAIIVYLAVNRDMELTFSIRPDSGEFNGFPSGHTAGAFVCAGFVCKKYGFLYSIPFLILAILVAISRVTSQRHTIFQVVAGALIGFFVPFFILKKFSSSKKISNNRSFMKKIFGARK